VGPLSSLLFLEEPATSFYPEPFESNGSGVLAEVVDGIGNMGSGCYQCCNFWSWNYFPQLPNTRIFRVSASRLKEFYCINMAVPVCPY
jgi:hypothetical protein